MTPLTKSGCQRPFLLRTHGAGQDLARLVGSASTRSLAANDRDSLPETLRPALLSLLLETLAEAVSPTQPHTFQPGNAVVVRKLFGCVSYSALFITDFSSPPCCSGFRSISSRIRSRPSSTSSARRLHVRRICRPQSLPLGTLHLRPSRPGASRSRMRRAYVLE